MDITKRRAVVETFAALVRRPLNDGNNALCWRRTLAGDFAEVARRLAPTEGVVDVDAATLANLPLSAPGRVAADVMRDDLHALAGLGREPLLSCVASYPRDERRLPIATDVMSFHADSAPVEVDTWLCTYVGKPSEGLDNDNARKLVDDPAIRSALLRAYAGDGDDDDGFAAYVREGAFDQHYAIVGNAQPFSFGVGHLWKIAVAWPGCPVPPCLHRAPEMNAGDEPRLLLIC